MSKQGLGAGELRKFGLMRWKSGELDLAVQSFEAALVLEPDNAMIWEDLCGVQLASGNSEMALGSIRRSIGIDDQRAQSWLMLATVLDRMQDQDLAASAYSQTIMLDETIASAHFGLGIIQLRRGKPAQALQCLQQAVTHDPQNANAHLCLGHACYATGDFVGTAKSLDAAGKFGPLDPASALVRIKAITFQAIIEGKVDEALANYSRLADAGDGSDDISQEAFALLNAHGYRDAARLVGQFRLRRDPDDAVQRYMNSAVAGEQLPRAPVDYVERHFDRLAPGFDRKLVDSLQYRGPEIMAQMIAVHRRRFDHILDLGCGTGLAAKPLSQFGGAAIGVDLSAAMLLQAEERRFYSELRKAEAIEFLAARPAKFDLIFAADVLVYIGDLRAFFGALVDVLVKDGIIALSIETTNVADFELRPSGRFAHSVTYVEKLASEHFVKLESMTATLRLEMRHPIEGEFMIFRKR
jgi:predicted TPR repeat methyltransferase